MKEKYVELDELEEVKFKIDKDAFRPKVLHCSKCNTKMKKTELDVQVDNQIYLKMEGFECSNCKKRYLGLEEAIKLDKAMVFSRALNKDFKMERTLSFDGDNYVFRIPKEFTRQINKRKIEIVPLGAKEFCAIIG